MRRFQRKIKHSLNSIADTQNLTKSITLQRVVFRGNPG